MLRSLSRHVIPLTTTCRVQTRRFGCTSYLQNSNDNEKHKQDKANEEDAWEQANIDPSTIANHAIPQPVSNAIPNSMLAAFNNMFDRGPNVGIEVITKRGFVLSNHIKVDQPLILLNGSPFLWNAPARTPGFIPMKDWDLDAFKIFEIVSPRPELIMFGTGREFAPIPEHVRQYFFNLGIQVDQMNSVSLFFFSMFVNLLT
jgi:NADH dehydrogenase [ubiquinone] 1 alpha subcomplex assembly factor 3